MIVENGIGRKVLRSCGGLDILKVLVEIYRFLRCPLFLGRLCWFLSCPLFLGSCGRFSLKVMPIIYLIIADIFLFFASFHRQILFFTAFCIFIWFVGIFLDINALLLFCFIFFLFLRTTFIRHIFLQENWCEWQLHSCTVCNQSEFLPHIGFPFQLHNYTVCNQSEFLPHVGFLFLTLIVMLEKISEERAIVLFMLPPITLTETFIFNQRYLTFRLYISIPKNNIYSEDEKLWIYRMIV